MFRHRWLIALTAIAAVLVLVLLMRMHAPEVASQEVAEVSGVPTLSAAIMINY
jgi:hypothetical protein